MNILFNFLLGMIKKVLFFGAVFAIVVFIWNFYKAKRESRTFISQFSNVDGLSKGAPIFSSGIEIGKVIKIFPIGNSNNVAVKGLITSKNYPSPKGSINSRIITNFQGGGGKALELLDTIYESELERIGLREDEFIDKQHFKESMNAPSLKVVLRILRDTYQMSKDFAVSVVSAISSPQSQEYQENIKNSVNNAITSLEYGTVKQDIKHGIEQLNDKIHDYEKKPNKEAQVERTIKNQILALRNTLDSYANLSKTYKDN